ncbi:Alpha/beta hydrolase family protein [Lacunisphaera limnophila]|uniref:Alpha/beta hydrolase family protein n=1 Tax=Lacunisphaera limnophila TaxID=1838286 RepID=A0A1I7PHD9_9BACT|nr:alpha/beta fold hydrolase [Lacunisphaera limnophila]AOS43017.1 Alpha/beta hydrolase family protein [Lacunisphaera limnophila]
MHSGFQHLPIPEPTSGGSFPAIVQYPTTQPAAGVSIGPFNWEATLDATPAPGRFPVCLIAHGAGGSHLLYREIATHLARSGWIVVCPEAPRDNRNDNSLAYTDEAVTNRCRQLSQTLDALLGHPTFGPAANPQRVGLVGHSLGGCAALALAGGQPWSRNRTPIPVQPDPRFQAAVLLAPATGYYRGPDALARVSGRFLVLAGEKDDVTPAEAIRQDLRPLPAAAAGEFVVVRGAGHYSFLSPFPAMMRRPDFPPGQDPDGFDRPQFHTELPGLIESFLSRSLPDA